MSHPTNLADLSEPCKLTPIRSGFTPINPDSYKPLGQNHFTPLRNRLKSVEEVLLEDEILHNM